ncbi:MAG TPA: aromatic ring-hydroxylating dioxygenase subunit alpha [Cyclobacteriaceae bacterium]|nr:aromatic ring-hydroxylating dioxygenase subunit alpha [Cyclobacteriaceae bacterium]
MQKLEMDPNIATAKTLSTEFYLSKAYYEASKEKIFAKTWQLVGDREQIKENGWVTPVNLLEHLMNEPLILSRDKNGDVHCLSNVCTHRGNLMVEQPCKLNDIRCKYHGRRFQLDGKFMSMPEFKEVENFPTEDDNLSSLPLHTWGQWIFTSLNPMEPASAFLDFMTNRIGWMDFEKFHFRPDLSKDYLVTSSWALYCENYLEGFHIPFVHAGLNAAIDYSSYTIELSRYSSLQLGIAKEGELTFDLPKESPDYGKKVAGYYFWVFPNLMFNFYPWGLSVNIVSPMDVDKCKVSFRSYVYDESKLRQGAGSNLHKVEMEDEDIVQNVQKGIRSRFYKHGRYSVKQERGTHHFHCLISEFMNKQ